MATTYKVFYIYNMSTLCKTPKFNIHYSKYKPISLTNLEHSSNIKFDTENTYNPYDKAGSYGIQDFFSVHVNKINGCFYNVMGFPLSSFYYHFSKIIKK